MIGYLENFNSYNISSTMWAARPNTYDSWSTAQPDATINENSSIRLITTTDLIYNSSTTHNASDFQYIFDKYYKN